MMKPTWKLFSNKKFINAVLATSIVVAAVAAPSPFDQKAKAASVQLKDISAGSTIKFAGYDWIVLDPSTGYVLMKDNLGDKAFDMHRANIFNPSDSNNIGYHLNSTWFGGLPEDQRARVQEKTWSTGNQNNESSSSVSAKVGLISYSEVHEYKDKLIHISSWTRTPSFSSWDYVWRVEPDSFLIEYYSEFHDGSVHPALYLISGLSVSVDGTIFSTPPPTAPNVTADDANNKILDIDNTMEYKIDGGSWIAYNAATPPDLSGSKTVEVRVKASGGVPVGEVKELMFTNQTPTAKTLPNQTTSKGTNKDVNLSSSFSDADGDPLTYTASSSDTGVATVIISGDTLTITPVSQGTSNVTVTADDGKGGTVSQSFGVTVVNQIPTATTLPDQTTNRATDSIVDVSTYFTDADEDVLLYTVDSSDTSVATATISGDTLTITPVSLGTSNVTVAAADGNGGTVSQTFTMTVANRTPTATTLPDQTTNRATDSIVDVSTYFTDADGDALTYSASSTDDGIATATISGNTLTITPVSLGTSNITVTAADGNGGTVSQSFGVTVANQIPTATTLPDQTTNRATNSVVDVSSYFTDADGDALTYTAVSSDTSVATATISGDTLTITPVSLGTSNVTVAAADGNGGTVSQTFTMTVANRTPTATSIPNQWTYIGSNSTMDISTYFMDEDGDALTFTASSSDIGIATTNITGNILTITAVSQGLSNVTITVDDGKGGTVSQIAKVQVVFPTPDPTPIPTPDPAPIVHASEQIKTFVKNGKIQLQVKDEKTGEWKPALIENTQSTGGYFIIQTGNQGKDMDLQWIELPQGGIKVVVLVNDHPYTYFDIGIETAPTKEWQVKFSAPLLNKPENLENITVQDASGNKIDIKVTLSEDGKTAIITPNIPYKKGELYYMTIVDTYSERGKQQKEPIRKIFIVE